MNPIQIIFTYIIVLICLEISALGIYLLDAYYGLIYASINLTFIPLILILNLFINSRVKK